MLAALDDCQLNNNGIYVYSHALYLEDDTLVSLVFTGTSSKIYYPRHAVTDFLNDNLNPLDTLVACSHYRDYPFWPAIFKSNHDHLSRFEKKLLTQAHHSAKIVAKEALNRYKSVIKP